MSAGHDELDSQLSAMFDDELPAAECELLARRLARDEALKARWGRYATIGAAIRAERGLSLNSPLSRRVSTAIAAEPSLLVGSAGARQRASDSSLRRWWQPAAGAAVAASVAALAILWMRQQGPETGFLAGNAAPSQSPVSPVIAERPVAAQRAVTAAQATTIAKASTVASASTRSTEPDSYVVPAASESTSIVPPTVLANFVVAHSEFSTPLVRHNLLSALVAAEAGNIGVQPAGESVKVRRVQNAEPAR
jgi:sigma-E factor negative regulatory protein RseA